MVEEARLESVYTPKAYRGFESRSLRDGKYHDEIENNKNKIKIRELLILKIKHTMKNKSYI